MTIMRKIFVGAVVTALASVLGTATASVAVNYSAAPTIDFALPSDGAPNYVRESLAVRPDGSYWICVEQGGISGIVEFAANSSGIDSNVDAIPVGLDPCTDLAADTEGNLYYAVGSTLMVFANGPDGLEVALDMTVGDDSDIDGIFLDANNTMYLYLSSQDIWVFPAGVTSLDSPARVIDGSNLSGDDTYIAASADGTVFVADYSAEAIYVFEPDNAGPVWDREITYDNGSYSSFGGITLNGTSLFVTFQDGEAPGIYEFSVTAAGLTEPLNSWSGNDVVSAGDDALYDVSIGGCSGQLIAMEGYNDRILTWDLEDAVCPLDDDGGSGDGGSLANTGFNSIGLLAGALTVAATGMVLALSRRPSQA